MNVVFVLAISAAALLVAYYLLGRVPMLLGVYLAACAVAPFLLPPIAGLVGAPIMFFHVPLARVCSIGFTLAAWYGFAYLRKRDPEDDIKSAAAVEVGFLFAFLATIDGAFFSRINWGEFWSWDPRQTSAFFLLLIYGAYLALRTSLESGDARARLSSVYAILAFFSAIFLIYFYPHLYKTLHPKVKMEMDAIYQIVLYSTMLGYAGLWIWLFRAAVVVTKKEAMTQAQFFPLTSKEDEVTWTTQTSS